MLFFFFRRYSLTVIHNQNSDAVVFPFAAQQNFVAGIFKSVAEQVADNALNQQSVAADSVVAE